MEDLLRVAAEHESRKVLSPACFFCERIMERMICVTPRCLVESCRNRDIRDIYIYIYIERERERVRCPG